MDKKDRLIKHLELKVEKQRQIIEMDRQLIDRYEVMRDQLVELVNWFVDRLDKKYSDKFPKLNLGKKKE